jgi:aspartate-semialdehyde dehydrogenase
MKNVVILGATGLVGEEVLKILEQRNFPVKELFLFASERSEGRTVMYKTEEVEIMTDYDGMVPKADIVFGCLDAVHARDIVPKFRDHAVVIDNSNAFRMDPDVPLIVPEVNPDRIQEHKGIIANPNCSTIQMVVPLFPLHQAAGIKRIIVSTYQSVSGMGRDAVDELQYEIECLGIGQVIEKEEGSAFLHPIADNIIPQIGEFDGSGYTTEEMKMVNETRKIFSDDTISVTATCVRIPVFIGHSEVVSVEFKQPLSPEQACSLLKDAPGITLLNEPQAYPMPVQVKGTDAVFVGRIRQDFTFQNGLTMWCVADNLRKGAALNAVQIAELLV